MSQQNKTHLRNCPRIDYEIWEHILHKSRLQVGQFRTDQDGHPEFKASPQAKFGLVKSIMFNPTSNWLKLWENNIFQT